MYYDKGKYESLIMNSPLFGIDKEQETTAYKRESYKWWNTFTVICWQSTSGIMSPMVAKSWM